jgi:hypothetical protein
MSASQRSAAARSASVMRAQTIVRARMLRTEAAISRISSTSRSPMAGMPISISGTPAASSARAMASFSSSVKATPAVCSPSRRVVSLMVSRGVASRSGCTAGSRVPGLPSAIGVPCRARTLSACHATTKPRCAVCGEGCPLCRNTDSARSWPWLGRASRDDCLLAISSHAPAVRKGCVGSRRVARQRMPSLQSLWGLGQFA